MLGESTTSYYDILEISPNSNAQEIRQAYLKLKLAYSKGSVALYSLVSAEDTQAILKKIEEAYAVLSSDEKRREYDRSYAQVSDPDSPFAPQTTQKNSAGHVISIDRTPPMEKNSRDEDVLVAPITDFSTTAAAVMGASQPQETLGLAPVTTIASAASTLAQAQGTPVASSSSFVQEPRLASGGGFAYQPTYTTTAPILPTQTIVQGKSIKAPDDSDPTLLADIEKETEWPGQFLRKIRESKAISIEELSVFTKISKTYLHAIENEDFPKLPASTFVRGFMIQIAKRLKLPHDKVAAAYVSRYRKACPEKS